MKITRLKLNNIKSFKGEHSIVFSKKINLLVGKNNTGKSTILSAIHNIQMSGQKQFSLTYPEKTGRIEIFVDELSTKLLFHINASLESIIAVRSTFSSFFIEPHIDNQMQYLNRTGSKNTLGRIRIDNNYHYIIPFLSRRKTGENNYQIDKSHSETIKLDFSNLAAKVDRLDNSNAQPINGIFTKACEEIIGFQVSSVAAGNGKEPAYMIYNLDNIPIREMGEGIINMLGLIVDLCLAEDKLFLIEEPENDLHPQAQKALCKLILENASKNQFIISTHSNIIVKSLGVEPETKIFHLTTGFDDITPKLMVSTINEIGKTKEARIKVLEDLGYEFNDYDHWAAWLFFEESSAEELVRNYFIKWYVPELLTQLRTFSAGSLSKVKTKFKDFTDLFVFIHLESIYKNKAWVVVDGGEGDEKDVIEKLKETYVSKNGWSEDRFRQLSNHDFESYYPQQFQEEVNRITTLSNNTKREAKAALLHTVKEWIMEDEDRAKVEFETSAKEIIDILKEIKDVLK